MYLTSTNTISISNVSYNLNQYYNIKQSKNYPYFYKTTIKQRIIEKKIKSKIWSVWWSYQCINELYFGVFGVLIKRIIFWSIWSINKEN